MKVCAMCGDYHGMIDSLCLTCRMKLGSKMCDCDIKRDEIKFKMEFKDNDALISIDNKMTSFSKSIFSELENNSLKHSGRSWHFFYEWWVNARAWTIISLIDGKVDEESLNYYGLRIGLDEYKKSYPEDAIFVYRFNKKKGKFITRKQEQ